MDTEVAVIGGGLVGMAVALGLRQLGRQVTVFDEGDRAFRASRGNFGLVWVQGKGVGLPDYARWTRQSADLWPAFADELRELAGVNVELSQPGGIDIFLSEAEAEAGVEMLNGLKAALEGDYPFEYLGHNALKKLVPEIGPDVVGATYSPMDGHVNPLYLLRALHTAFKRAGGRIENSNTVERIELRDGGFRIVAGNRGVRAEKVVLCAGLDNARLAPMVGLSAPVEPVRGQLVICERVRPFLKYPSVQIRQVGEGAVQIGDSKEHAGFNDATTPQVISRIAHRAVRIYPLLEHVRMVRSWGSLRVMSPDGHPIYDRSPECPGAALVTCHSGVTLAAAHAKILAKWIAGVQQTDHVESFSAKRFDVRQVA
jgi:glycine/D-amino acid oxidase-like deaminating enzyme